MLLIDGDTVERKGGAMLDTLLSTIVETEREQKLVTCRIVTAKIWPVMKVCSNESAEQSLK